MIGIVAEKNVMEVHRFDGPLGKLGFYYPEYACVIE